ncbi:MAG: hypothetical protein KJ989_01225 [Gammaproteobacteria bacterium]|nr:hypothetical protein [Gammaproteobacteria bacterium]MBU2158390.1 hypothetical protein [Gammaproteobacteria bacterium]MBU2292806.1 hypothetical protein [Gammaproteobacteria bacterium]
MSHLGTALLSALVILTSTLSASANEPEEHYIEFANLVLNLEEVPGSDRATGYVLATACATCQPTRIEIDETTELRLNGDQVPLKKLGFKIDWQGAVFFIPGKPSIATRLMLQ